MRIKRHTTRAALAAALLAGAGSVGPSVAHAAPPVVAQDDGAFVRIVGNPLDGTAKFQFGWSDSTVASDAAGYWLGIYDVTHSTYVWSYDTGAVDLPSAYRRNAHPTADLPDGDYKVVFFVRGAYGPSSNLAEIELPFAVQQSIG